MRSLDLSLSWQSVTTRHYSKVGLSSGSLMETGSLARRPLKDVRQAAAATSSWCVVPGKAAGGRCSRAIGSTRLPVDWKRETRELTVRDPGLPAHLLKWRN